MTRLELRQHEGKRVGVRFLKKGDRPRTEWGVLELRLEEDVAHVHREDGTYRKVSFERIKEVVAS